MFWFPFTHDIPGTSGNNERACVKLNKGSCVSFSESQGASILDAYFITRLPPSQLYGHPCHQIDEHAQKNTSAPATDKF